MFNLKDGNKVGFFANDSIDSISKWKYDKSCFLFNLNQNKKYNKKKSSFFSFDYPTLCCKDNCGPSTSGLGCIENCKLNVISHSFEKIDSFFENGSQILPSKVGKTNYKVKETEVFQIIIE